MITAAFDIANEIAAAVSAEGGEAFFVGECVRDMLRDVNVNSLTIEVYKLNRLRLRRVLQRFDSFKTRKMKGEFKLDSYPITVVMPSTVIQTQEGAVPIVETSLSKETAAARRVFTANALLKNILTGEIIDPYGGKADIVNFLIRAISPDMFTESPIQVFRAAAFASTTDFKLSRETGAACRMADLTKLSKEEVFAEVKNALLNFEHPSYFFGTLRTMKQFDFWFPEIKALVGTPHNEEHHKEGDVWIHTMKVLDEAAKKRDCADNPLGLMLSALCHDFGKATTTTVDDNGIHHSYGHEAAGVALANEFLNRLGVDAKLKAYVLNMVELHHEPHKKVNQNSSEKSFNHMFDRSVCPMDLIALFDCDCRGRLPSTTDETDVVCQKFNAYCKIMSEPYITIKELLAAGAKNERIDELMDYAHKLRLAGVAKETALKQVLAYKPTTTKG